ncbi:MAG: TlpA family protein disulfide reductase [Bacteroidetes bacterium]|nr:MAG: TlpA family protein disulfide reductase [Bacteroidota bacterium]
MSVSIQESNTAVEGFIAKYGLTYPFLLDTTGDASRSYNVYTTPTTYFINPDGVITDMLPGVMRQQWIDQQMAGLSS